MAPYTGNAFPRICAYQHVLGPAHKFDARDRPILYDVKFMPFADPDADSLFAITGGREVFVCRPQCLTGSGRENSEKCTVDVVSWIRDESPDAWPNNSLAWAVDPAVGEPLICVAGTAVVKIFSAIDGRLVRHLIGHGGHINDLLVSPMTPNVLLSASVDKAIRVWRLSKKFESKPCSHILAGALGHKEEILAMCYHPNGRYILSGGHDCIVNLWALPEFSEDDEITNDPVQIQHPHFSSSEVHSDFIDSIQFYGDLILSRCANENKILLWSITGFSTRDPVPEPSAAPARALKGRDTRSAWASKSCIQRLLQFETRDTSSFYMRFGLYQSPIGNSMLAMGNLINKLYFWDLTGLEIPGYREPDFKVPEKRPEGAGAGRGQQQTQPHQKKGTAARLIRRESSTVSNATGTTEQSSDVERSASGGAAGQGARNTANVNTLAPPTDVSLPFRSIKPHHIVPTPRMQFATRQVAWSSDGRWCVQVGEHGMVCLYHRGGDGGRAASAASGAKDSTPS